MEKLILSGVNLTEGGPLTVYKDAIKASIEEEGLTEIICLVNSKSLFKDSGYDESRVRFIEYPMVKNSWFLRILFEYVFCFFLALRFRPTIWLSLHDCSPILPRRVRQYVYCHNPSPFYKAELTDYKYDFKFVIFTFLYKAIYKFNISSNHAVIVQQLCVKELIETLSKDVDIIVARPELKSDVLKDRHQKDKLNDTLIRFFYPALPRTFKNHSLILRSLKELEVRCPTILGKIEITLTIDKGQSRYSRFLYNEFLKYDCVNMIGLVSKTEVDKLYARADALLFPSKLETWGLPLSEAKAYHLPIIAPNLAYAKETIGNYDKLIFIDPDDSESLSNVIKQFAGNNIEFCKNTFVPCDEVCSSWSELFGRIV